MSLINFAQKELLLLEKDLPIEDIVMQKHINDNILEIIKLISKQGHSGSTIFYLLENVEKLCKFKALTPLIGDDGEWNHVGNDSFGGELYQNNRCHSVFKDSNKCYDIDAIVYEDQDGYRFISGELGFKEISFPYTPGKVEVIKVNI
jgi:hypothetical protein